LNIVTGLTAPIPFATAPAAEMTLEVTISGLQVAADIGVYAHEHGRAQPLVVDIILKIDAPAGDLLNDTIDYQCIADEAHALALERTALIETYAMRLAERCIANPGVQGADVRVSKPGALRGGLAGARVSLARGGL
jgi:dihydroneopterin aldolase